MIEFSMVPAEYVDTCWHKIEQYAKKAADKTEGRFTLENLYEMTKEENQHLWVAYDVDDFKGFVLTSINSYPKRKILSMNFCGGKEYKTWKRAMFDTLKSFAKDIGCDSLEAYGRPGWSKILKDEGYKSKFVAFEIPV